MKWCFWELELVRPGTGGVDTDTNLLLGVFPPLPALGWSLSEHDVRAWSTAILSTNCWRREEIPAAFVPPPPDPPDTCEDWLPGTTTMLCFCWALRLGEFRPLPPPPEDRPLVLLRALPWIDEEGLAATVVATLVPWRPWMVLSTESFFSSLWSSSRSACTSASGKSSGRVWRWVLLESLFMLLLVTSVRSPVPGLGELSPSDTTMTSADDLGGGAQQGEGEGQGDNNIATQSLLHSLLTHPLPTDSPPSPH